MPCTFKQSQVKSQPQYLYLCGMATCVAAHATLHISGRLYRSYLVGYQCTVNHMDELGSAVTYWSTSRLVYTHMIARQGYM